jgi:5,10-methenyltetrahydrofolate synthetase
MERGIWNIPVPAEGEGLQPDIVVSPVVGLDAHGYRLGNGGGYYDRTLAAAAKMPLCIGIGQDFARIPTIYPMHWDIPMQLGVFGDGTIQRFD